MTTFTAMLLLFCGLMLFGAYPFAGFALCVIGVVMCNSHRVRFESDLPEVLMFYAAVAGCFTVWLS